MKFFIYLFILTILFTSCLSEPHFDLKGKIDDSDGVKFFICKRNADKIIRLDSAISRKGNFKMTGSIEYPDMVLLISENAKMQIPFYLENSEITISGNFYSPSTAKIIGSKTQDEYQSVIDSSNLLNEKYSDLKRELQIVQKSGDIEKLAQLQKTVENFTKEFTEMQKNFVRNNPGSYVALGILNRVSDYMDPEEIEKLVNAMDTNVANIPATKELKKRITILKSVSVGRKAPDFTLNDTCGNPVTLYSKIGSKLLLIDFWAAWCGSCREENPNLVKIYNEFHIKGLEIIGISLDRTKKDWVKAITDDKLTWTQSWDPEYGPNIAANLYSVNWIPANILLDEKGNIIAKNIMGKDLYYKVNEILGTVK